MDGASDQRTRFRAEEPDQLLATQEPAVRTVVRGVARLARDNEMHHHHGRPAEFDLEATKRPHQVFLIDGSRGAGKTYTLLTVELALKELSKLCIAAPSVEGNWKVKLNSWLAPLSTGDLQAVARRYGALTHTLRIIFPGDMEDGDTVMEALFAAMTSVTAAAAQACEKTDQARGELGKSLNKKLREDVAQGWYFARRFGTDAIVRDSTDYEDLVLRFEAEARKAAHRIDVWRSYIDKYLEFHQAAMLVVLLDDSDVRSELTDNILHAIRMYLDHPRIVTVLAGNLKSMRISLLHLKMSALGDAVTALNSKDHPTAREWRRHERKEIEDYLEKVLPPEQRIRVNRPQLLRNVDASGRPPVRSDFEVVVEESLDKVCSRLMHQHRTSFLDVKFKLAISRELGRSDAPSPAEKRTLEYFLSWWLFSNRYREQLQPRSVRQLKTWKMFYEEATGKFANTKRLPVMLFDNPANFTLIHRMSDEDESVSEWLRRQEIESSWVGRRRFRVNDSDIDEGTYTYNYVKYRLDLGIAMPMRDNSDEVVSKVMLPALMGRSFMRRFFQPRRGLRHRPHRAGKRNLAEIHRVGRQRRIDQRRHQGGGGGKVGRRFLDPQASGHVQVDVVAG